MNSTIYEKIGRVDFQRDNIDTRFDYVNEFEDNDDEIVIRSYFQIDSVYRGWLGNITYWASIGTDAKSFERVDLMTGEPCCVKDVLCVRVNVTLHEGEPVMWEYVFLKY